MKSIALEVLTVLMVLTVLIVLMVQVLEVLEVLRVLKVRVQRVLKVQTVPSGLTAVLVATSPFWMVGFDALMPDGQRITWRRALGLVIGFVGIVMLVLATPAVFSKR